MKTCPQCGRDNPEDANLCSNCGWKFIFIHEHPVKKKSFIPILLLTVLILCIGIFGVSSLFSSHKPISCAAQSQSYLNRLDPLLNAWDDANSVASSTARIALSGPVGDLQSIRRQVSDLAHPDCANTVHQYAIGYMDSVIKGYLSFMAKENESTTQSYFDLASNQLDKFTVALSTLK